MDTSSESDSFDRTRGHRPRGRDARRVPGRDSGIGCDGRTADISEKISTLATTLQDTSRNLTKVDRMLGHYREHTDEQAEAMALLRENLEESIGELQAQRASRPCGPRCASASASTLQTSDLEVCSGSDGQHFYPPSPPRDYAGTPRRRRRSQSASVRFKDKSLSEDDIHTLHQSLRDLRCGQHRLSTDLDREILRRNRCDIDTRRAMDSLTDNPTPASVSSRVERRLQELERQVHPEQSGVHRERPDQWAAVSDNLQETSGRHQVQAQERERARLLRAGQEKSKMEQELEAARRLLGQSEDSREALVQQVEDMRGELLRMRKEKTDFQLKASQHIGHPHGNHTFRDGGQRGADGVDLEKEVAELRAQLHAAAVVGEVEELKRTLDRKEKERVQLRLQVEDLSSERAQREQQQLRMLEQLREMQSRGQAERKETEALLQESTRSRDELKTRAQEAVRQWRAKCRRLQKDLEEARAQAQVHTDEASQVARVKESAQAQLKALSQQTEAARRELADVLGRLAQREEELHRKDVELSEIRQRHLSLEQEIREMREASASLEEDTQRLAAAKIRLREENQRLEEQAEIQARQCQRDQAALKQMTSAHAHLTQRLAEEESSKHNLQKGSLELQAKLQAAQEERATLGQQLQLERAAHQAELENTKAMTHSSRTKKDWEVQDMLRLCQRERDEIKAHLEEVKADAASDRELCGGLRTKLDRMKEECDKLAAQLSTKDHAHALLHTKYQLLKQEVDDKARSAERRRASESELVKLEEKLSRMEAEREALLTSTGEALDTACRSLANNAEDKLQAISQKPGLVKDPHRWLAETKTKIRWLCEEVRESTTREQRLRKQQQQTRDQLEALRQSRDSEQRALLQRLDQQEELLLSLDTEKRELLERSRRKEEEMRSLQDRVLDLEMNTRVALDHLDSIPDKQCLMENFKDLEESQRQREVVEQRYAQYKEIVWDLQHQLDESKRRIQEYRDEKLDATTWSLRLAALSSSVKGPGPPSPHRRLTSSDLDDKPLTD
ncbi:centrosomal protein of 128 kDa isoform X1 [Pungitius pungitius]|uniref:centrosomal protein of 128 kDa isoform X1 n=1 Tax=Pungitius pungitius TaxID=134920 RepID=UPI002E125606